MTVIWSGVTSEGAVVPVQVDGVGRVVATTGEPPGPPVIEYSGASAWGNVAADGTLQGGLNASVTKTGPGNYTVTFLTPLPDANYSAVGSTNRGSNNLFASYNQTASGFSYETISADNAVRVDEAASFVVNSQNALPPEGGTGTDSWGSVDADGSLLASFNVASVTRTGTGVYDVVFVTPMPTNSYAVTTGGTPIAYIFDNEKTTTGFTYYTYEYTSGFPATNYACSFQVNATNAVLPVTVTAEQLHAVTNNWYLEGENDASVLTTRYKVEMQDGIVFAGGKAGITRDGELYFTSNGGKYVIAVNDEQIGLTRIDSAY